jgi:hypothetical protein
MADTAAKEQIQADLAILLADLQVIGKKQSGSLDIVPVDEAGAQALERLQQAGVIYRPQRKGEPA